MERYYWIKPPQGRHRSFRIICLEKQNQTQQVVSDERIDSINALFHAGTVDSQVAKRQLAVIVEELRSRERGAKPEYLDANLDIVDRFMQEVYGGRDIAERSRQSIRYSCKKAVSLLGSLNFTTAPAEVIQGRIYTTKYNQRAHLVLVLNMLFKYIGRKERFKIGKNRAASAAVKHLTLVEMLKVADNIKDPVVRLAALTAFGTGCRVGELFPISTFNDTAHTVRIISQIDIFGVERHIKTFDGRVAVVIHELLAHVREWIALPVAERMKIRNYRLSSIMKAACRKTFPGDSSKECHFYDLRHSYAIHFLSLGATVDIIAAALGNSPEVCRKHYTGFVLTEGGIALMNALQRKAG